MSFDRNILQLRDLPPLEAPADETDSRSPGAALETTTADSAYLQILAEAQDDRRTLKRALAAAVLLHLVVLFIHLPSFQEPIEVTPAGKRKAYVVQQVRFSPPQAAPKREVQKKKTRIIPIPDPTPDDPEPIREQELDLPDMDLDLPVGELNLDIPEGPPGLTWGGQGPLDVGGDVMPPKKIYAPQPRYTEEARQARIQGVTLLQAIIDPHGDVVDLKILKGLPLGLDQSALETVQQWKFEPATKNGKPVPVYYNVTVHFSLQ